MIQALEDMKVAMDICMVYSIVEVDLKHFLYLLDWLEVLLMYILMMHY